ncbi:MAG TPA: hypothetical protein VGK67_38640 [Myxococcales bacterium]|jgi:hypothetical protein
MNSNLTGIRARCALLALLVSICSCALGGSASYSGTVLDRATDAGIEGIWVKCKSATDSELNASSTYANGSFSLCCAPCDHLEATDVASPARYVEQKNIPARTETIYLDPVK